METVKRIIFNKDDKLDAIFNPVHKAVNVACHKKLDGIATAEELQASLNLELKPYVEQTIKYLNEADPASFSIGNFGNLYNWLKCNIDKTDLNNIKTALYGLYKKINQHYPKAALEILDTDIPESKNRRGRPNAFAVKAAKINKYLVAMQNTLKILKKDKEITVAHANRIRTILKTECLNIVNYDEKYGYYYPIVIDFTNGFDELTTRINKEADNFRKHFGSYKLMKEDFLEKISGITDTDERGLMDFCNELDMRQTKSFAINEISKQFNVDKKIVISILRFTLDKNRRFATKINNDEFTRFLSPMTLHNKTVDICAINRRVTGTVETVARKKN